MKKLIILLISSFILLWATFADHNICWKLEVNNFNQQVDRFIYFNWLNNYLYLKRKEDWQYVVVHNWKESNEYESISNVKSFNNWEDYFFVAQKEDKKYVIVYNWKESNEYKNIDSSIFILKWDKTIFSKFNITWLNYIRYEYIDKSQKTSFKVLANNLSKNGIIFIADNKIIEWLNNWKIKELSKNQINQIKSEIAKLWYQVLFDWKKYFRYSNIDGSADFNYKWDYTLSVTTINWKEVIIYNWKTYKNLEEVKKLMYSEDTYKKNNKNIYIKQLKPSWKYVVVYNRVVWKIYDRIIKLIISKDGKHYAFIAKKQWKWIVIKDWKEIINKNNISYIKFLSNNNLIYTSRNYKNKIDNLIYNWINILTWNWINVENSMLKHIWNNDYLFYIWGINYNKSVFVTRKICKTTSTYIDNEKYNYYKNLIIKKLWKKIDRIPTSKRILIWKKVNVIIDKIKNNDKYTEKEKIQKVTLFTAFKDVLLEFSVLF